MPCTGSYFRFHMSQFSKIRVRCSHAVCAYLCSLCDALCLSCMHALAQHGFRDAPVTRVEADRLSWILHPCGFKQGCPVFCRGLKCKASPNAIMPHPCNWLERGMPHACCDCMIVRMSSSLFPPPPGVPAPYAITSNLRQCLVCTLTRCRYGHDFVF